MGLHRVCQISECQDVKHGQGLHSQGCLLAQLFAFFAHLTCLPVSSKTAQTVRGVQAEARSRWWISRGVRRKFLPILPENHTRQWEASHRRVRPAGKQKEDAKKKKKKKINELEKRGWSAAGSLRTGDRDENGASGFPAEFGRAASQLPRYQDPNLRLPAP